MVQITSILLALVLSCPIGIIRAAPVNNTVDANTLLKNGHTAQHLNVKFKDLSINDQCTNGQEACISGALAKCDNAGKWEAQQCQSNSQCFVLPDVRSEGTKLRCVSEQQANSLIQASGAQGGVFGDGSTDASNSSDSSGTATVTVLIAPSTTQTLSPETTTLDSTGVSSLLASLESGSGTTVSGAEPTELNTGAGTSATVTSSGDGATATDDSSTASESAVATATTSEVNGAQGALATGLQGGAAAPTTIILTTGSSTATATDPSATPDAAAASAPPSAPPSNGGY